MTYVGAGKEVAIHQAERNFPVRKDVCPCRINFVADMVRRVLGAKGP